MTTIYRVGGSFNDSVVIDGGLGMLTMLTAFEARQLADEYEAAVPQLRALADQAEANAREATAKREAEIAIALREPGAFRYGDRVLVARLDRHDRWRLWRVLVHDRGEAVAVVTSYPYDLDIARLPANAMPPIWARNASGRTAHLCRGGERAICGYPINRCQCEMCAGGEWVPARD